MQIFFVEKMWEAFAVQKLLSFFQQKYQCIWLKSRKIRNQLTSQQAG